MEKKEKTGAEVFVRAALYVKPECVAEFSEAAEKVTRLSRAEAGCVLYETLVDISDPCKFVFNEEYIDDAAFELHRVAPYLESFREIRSRCVDRYLGVCSFRRFGTR